MRWRSSHLDVLCSLRMKSTLHFTVPALLLLSACTDTDVYSALGGEPFLPDRLTLSGQLCTDDTAGKNFPAKILFVIDNSLQMSAADLDGARFSGGAGSPNPGSIAGIIARNDKQEHVRFGFVGVSDTSRALPAPDGQHFYGPLEPEVGEALIQLRVATSSRLDLVNAISQAGSFIANDLAESSAGEVLRSRYLVTMLFAGPDTSVLDINGNVVAGSVAPLVEGLVDQVEAIVEQVYAAGAMEIKWNVGLLHHGPRTIDQGDPTEGVNYNCYTSDPATDPQCPCTNPSATQCAGPAYGEPYYCAVYCDCQYNRISEARMTAARSIYEAIAFAGGGIFREFPCPPNIDLGVDVASSDVQLVKKDIVAFNRNVRLGMNGPVLDSDGDGLSDIDELGIMPPTSPSNWDSDGDWLGDRLEYRTYPRQNPLDASDRPRSCEDLVIQGFPVDRDSDLLNDCEEDLLQTSRSIPDTDGDGLPDLLEFLSGMIPISPDDRLLDFDADGVKNAEEVLAHTDPRSHEGVQRGVESYRNYIGDLGSREVASMEPWPALRGIAFRRASPMVAGGQAYLRWRPCVSTLEWSDSRYPVGPTVFTPQPMSIPVSGVYTLYAVAPNGQQIWAELEVTRELLPTCEETDEVIGQPKLTIADRHCYDVRISNIKLMQTLAANGGNSEGINSVLLFFTQAPRTRLTSPGITKVAEVLVQFRCEDPTIPETCMREPSAGFIEITEDMMVTALP